jgi:hypothetical protein
MSEFLLDAARYVHISLGFVGLTAFWFPIFAKKGGRLHVTAGKVFKWCAYGVLGAAAAALSLRVTRLTLDGTTPFTDPGPYGFLIFLAYLTVVTFVTVRHGFTVLHNKRDHAALRHPLNYALAWAAIASSAAIVAYALLIKPDTMIILLALSPIGFLGGRGILQFLANEPTTSRWWFYEHMGAMLGAGIAFHTAFFVFGSTRLFEIGLTGWIAALPWIAPAAIGIPGSAIWANYYRRRFGKAL